MRLFFLYRLLCSNVVCVVRSHSKVIPVIQNQVRSMSTTQKQNYFSLLQLLRGLQDPVDDMMGKILLLCSCRSASRLHLFPLIDHSASHL